LRGALPTGATATDLVLTVAQMLRKHGVVGKFVEFYGDGVGRVSLETRATIGNMSPEYGSTCTIFPIDEETLRYMRATARPDELVELVEAYAKEQGLWHEHEAAPRFDETLTLDLSTVEPSLAGPSRPQDRVPLRSSGPMFTDALAKVHAGAPRSASVTLADGRSFELHDGAVVIAAITSCTNTSNPNVMIAAGLLAQNAVQRGLGVPPWVKTSLAPGSLVVTDYYERAGLLEPLAQLGYEVVGYGCTTCIGNSGPLAPEISRAITDNDLSAVSVLSGNRNFEGRIHPDCRMNYLASPPLVVAYALAGTMTVDFEHDPLGTGRDGAPVYLRDIWPDPQEVTDVIAKVVDASMYLARYSTILEGDEHWRALPAPTGDRYEWDPNSTYIRRPPFLEGVKAEPAPLNDVIAGRALAKLGDSVTTDHISPAGSIRAASPAGEWLEAHGVAPREFNSYGSRRGNHLVMMRGTFANIRIRNQLAPGTEGGVTVHLPDGEQMTIFDAAMRYADEGVPLVVLAGKEYGTGSSRDWAAKGSLLLGIRAVLVESLERIHRSNLIGMGVLPLEFLAGESVDSHGLTGHEQFRITGLADLGDEVAVHADDREIRMRVRIDTPFEREVFMHGGILPHTLRRLLREQ
jgi:aconitate hydratase